MSKAVLFLLATTLGLGFISLHLVRTLREEREQVQSLQSRIDELERARTLRPQPFVSLPPAPAQAASPERQAPRTVAVQPSAAPQPAKPAATAVASAPPMPSREERIRRMREGIERQRKLLQDPEYRNAMRAQHKLMYARTHPDLAKELDLSADQADALLTLLADQQLQAMEGAGQPWLDGPPDQAEMQRMQREAQQRQERNEAAVAELLGPKMQAWKDYQATLGVRHQVNQLRGLLASKGLPLQEELVNPLMKALADEQQRLAQEMDPNASGVNPARLMYAPMGPTTNPVELQERQLDHMTRYYQRLRDAASSILSPEQLAVYADDQNAQLQMQRAQLRMMRMQTEAQGVSAFAPTGDIIVSPAMIASPGLAVAPR